MVSVAAHVVGNAMSDMVNAFFAGDLATARHLHHELFPVFEGLFRTTNPVLVKEALNLIGVPVGSVRLPLVSATTNEKQELKEVLSKWTPEVQVDVN